LGCFSALHAHEFPAIHPGLGIYIDLTNGRGQMAVKVQIVDTDEVREPIWVGESVVEFNDPRMVAEIDLLVAGLKFPEPGEYRVQVYANAEFIIERRLLVNKLEGTRNE
jgi:hypothetical protein